jgi:hypothetical protein
MTRRETTTRSGPNDNTQTTTATRAAKQKWRTLGCQGKNYQQFTFVGSMPKMISESKARTHRKGVSSGTTLFIITRACLHE